MYVCIYFFLFLNDCLENFLGWKWTVKWQFCFSVYLAYTTDVLNIFSAYGALYGFSCFTVYLGQKKCLIIPFIKLLGPNTKNLCPDHK